MGPSDLATGLREVHNRAGERAAGVLERAVCGISPSERARELKALVRRAAELSPAAPSRRALAMNLRARLQELARAPRSFYIDGGGRDGVLETMLLLYRRVPALRTFLRALEGG